MKGTSQFKTLPDAEQAIGKRLSAVRKFEGLSQTALATKSQSTRDQISNIEAGRVPLRAGLAMTICLALKINPQWLATGQGYPKYKGDLLDYCLKDCPQPKAFFSAFFKEHLAEHFDVLSERAMNNISNAVAATIKATDSLSKLPNSPLKRQLAAKQARSLTSFLGAVKQHKHEKRRMQELAGEYNLTEAATTDKTSDVKSPLANLRERLNKQTSEPGKKSELAEYLGAPLASVSRWLSGSREPGGEITLKMLHWVELQERK